MYIYIASTPSYEQIFCMTSLRVQRNEVFPSSRNLPNNELLH